MSEPVVFISHFAIKEGALDDLRRYSVGVRRIREEKPGTVLFLSYLDDEGGGGSRSSMPSPTPDALDRHFEAANEQPAAAYEFIEPRGWEFYGRPSEQVMETMRATAEKFGVPLVVEPEFNGGFLRLHSA